MGGKKLYPVRGGRIRKRQKTRCLGRERQEASSQLKQVYCRITGGDIELLKTRPPKN